MSPSRIIRPLTVFRSIPQPRETYLTKSDHCNQPDPCFHQTAAGAKHSRGTNMAAMLGGGDGMPLEQWFFEMPVCTRWWTTATVITGVLVQCHILTPFQLFYSFRAVWHKQQVRLESTTESINRERGVRKGEEETSETSLTIRRCYLVLAAPLHLHLLRPPLPQPPLPHLLHPALRPHARRSSADPRPLRLAPCLRLRDPPRHCAPLQPSLPRHHAEQHVGLHLESTESGY